MKSDNGVDGIDNGYPAAGSCTQTLPDKKPWWRVDLESSREISSVKIVGRSDCCNEALEEFVIQIGDTDGPGINGECEPVSNLGIGNTREVACNGVKGRYVYIQSLHQDAVVLSLCEV